MAIGPENGGMQRFHSPTTGNIEHWNNKVVAVDTNRLQWDFGLHNDHQSAAALVEYQVSDSEGNSATYEVEVPPADAVNFKDTFEYSVAAGQSADVEICGEVLSVSGV